MLNWQRLSPATERLGNPNSCAIDQYSSRFDAMSTATAAMHSARDMSSSLACPSLTAFVPAPSGSIPVGHIENIMHSKFRRGSRWPNLKIKRGLIVASAASLALGACATSSGLGQRELTQAEKTTITNAIAPSLRDAATAQYGWPKIQNTANGPVNYCGTVNAKSPYPAYNGRQAFIVSATVTGGTVSSAVVVLVAGGKDVEIVRNKCRKYNLDPDAS